MIFAEEDLLPISGLQHLVYCPRQFALIHIEQIWEENRFTAEGRLLHQRVDQQGSETRRDLHIAHALRLRSLRYGLSGIADVVEFHRNEVGVALSGRSGHWFPYPVEYKRGRPKKHNADAVQLCAQALCLEEMLRVELREGALFYGKRRRRKVVKFTDVLRQETSNLCSEMHCIWSSGQTPPPQHDERCDHCSLLVRCKPHLSENDSSRSYLDTLFEEAE